MPPATRGTITGAAQDALSSTTTSIPSKRPSPTDSDEKEIENVNINVPPKAKRIATSKKKSETKKPKRPAADKPSSATSNPPPPITQYVEKSPGWAWDIAGLWRITEGGLTMHNKLRHSHHDLQLQIFMTIDPGQNTRQLWARYDFSSYTGYIRFCPSRPIGTAQHQDLPTFEKACSLEDDVWAGPGSKGEPRWNVRMRGIEIETGKISDCEGFQSEVIFTESEDGSLTMKGGMIFDQEPLYFQAEKIARFKQPAPDQLTIRSTWNEYRPLNQLAMPSNSEDHGAESARDDEDSLVEGSPDNLAKDVVDVTPALSHHLHIGHITASWDVQGVYEINDCKIIGSSGYRGGSTGEIDPSGFSLKIYHDRMTPTRQLYATFAFDKLEGIMRIAHLGSKDGQYERDEFDEACELNMSTHPGPKQKAWVMRYRARDEGTRLNRLGDSKMPSFVGEEAPLEEFLFEKDWANSTTTFGSIKVCFALVYRDVAYDFHATRTSKLPNGDWANSSSLSRKWAGLTASADPITRPSGPNSTLNNTTREPELGVSPPTGKYIENLPTWAWDTTGDWVVAAPGLARDLGLHITDEMTLTMKVANNPLHRKAGRQLWGFFNFGRKLQGILRFAPILASENPPETLKVFESKCVLKSGSWPGAGQEKWSMRWRGKFANTSEALKYSDQYQTQVKFEMSEHGLLKLKGVIMYENQPKVFNATKTSIGHLPKGNETNVNTYWNSYKVATNRSGPATSHQPPKLLSKRLLPTYSVDKEDNDVAVQPKSKRAALSDQTNKSQPLPKLGTLGPETKKGACRTLSVPEPLSTSVETPASPFWDVTGRWEITAAPMIATSLGISPEGPMFMTMKSTTDGRHPAIAKHHLWATFVFGEALEGIMRFCLKRSAGNELSFFENACGLESGDTVCSEQPKWNMRWRGKDTKRLSNVTYSDGTQTEVVFERGEDGQLTLRGAMICNYLLCTFKAKKIAPGPRVKRDDMTAVAWWELYNPNHRFHHTEDQLHARNKASGPKSNTHTRPATANLGSSSQLCSFEGRSSEASTWDVEGNYEITKVTTCGKGFDGSGCSLRLFYATTTSDAAHDLRHLYAAFKFDSLDGLMRFAPNKARMPCYLKDFEKICDLDSKTQPGPNNTNWLMRWRAKDGGMRLGKRVGGEVDQQTEATFQLDTASSSSEFTAINFRFIMLYYDNIFIIDSAKVSNLDPATAATTWDMKEKWTDLFDTDWEDSDDDASTNSESDSESLARFRGSQGILANNYLDLLRSKHLDLAAGLPKAPVSRAKPTYKPRPTTNVIEEEPLWAWDIPGEWVVTAPQLAKELGLSSTDLLNLRFNISNNASQKKIRRQLWASFSSASPKVAGTFRFAPVLASGKVPETLKEFEDACVLEDGYWPGPSLHGGQERWFMRWRCRVSNGPSGFEAIEGCDEDQTQFNFEKHENGELRITGVIEYLSGPVAFEAKKLISIPTRQGGVDSVLKQWNRDKPNSRTGRSR